MAEETLKGGCMCGAVRFTARGAPKLVANCHCRSCRKATGAAFATFVDFNRDRVTFDGAPKAHPSSPGAERLFCETCGAPIAYRGEASPDEINIYLGAFDRPETFKPSEDCHMERALWKTKR